MTDLTGAELGLVVALGEDMTDYHELPEVPRCCGTCRYITTIIMAEAGDGCIHPARMTIDPVPSYPRVAPHGLCSHWERRDD